MEICKQLATINSSRSHLGHQKTSSILGSAMRSRSYYVVQVDLSGGYYDAGDNVKYQFPMAFTITLLSWSVIEYERELVSAGQMQYAQQAIKWGTDYFLKAITGPTQIWVQVRTLEACTCSFPLLHPSIPPSSS